jgi:squalene-associated FAD-dependent desaturase
MNHDSTQSTVAVAGGGLAGLAAACALADSGFRVTLFERRPYLGGRASSYEHPGTGEVVDNCQHVLFRVCTNLVEFYRRIGVQDNIRWFEDMTFIEPGGRTSVMRASHLPAPLHTAPSFLRFPFLSVKDKAMVARGIAVLTLTSQPDNGESFLQWCHHHGQTDNAIQRFWKPILVSALSEDLDSVSVSYASQVVRESMKSREARHMGVPNIPLTDLYNRAGDYIRQRGGEIHFRSSLETFSTEPSSSEKSPSKSSFTKSPGVRIRVGGREQVFDYLVLALPFETIEDVLPQTPGAAPLRERLSHFESSPITGIHLWFDRQITDLDHAVLLDRTIQWMFHKSRLLATRGSSARDESQGSYIELVVSASKSLIEKSRAEIIDFALNEVREFFPAAREANLLKSTVVKEVHATFSPRPGIDAYRPAQVTPWPCVFIAGDWTATGWPATMEGAVRSGYLAGEALILAAGMKGRRFLAPDLTAGWFMKIFH